jgi:hypothetical protein
MSSDFVVLDGITTYDFTTGSGQFFGTGGAAEVESGVWGMWAGDANGDGTIKYNGENNDRALVYVRIGGGSVNQTINGYFAEDVNLSGTVVYNGADGSNSFNDRGKIYDSIGGQSVNTTVSTQVP